MLLGSSFGNKQMSVVRRADPLSKVLTRYRRFKNNTVEPVYTTVFTIPVIQPGPTRCRKFRVKSQQAP